MENFYQSVVPFDERTTEISRARIMGKERRRGRERREESEKRCNKSAGILLRCIAVKAYTNVEQEQWPIDFYLHPRRRARVCACVRA